MKQEDISSIRESIGTGGFGAPENEKDKLLRATTQQAELLIKTTGAAERAHSAINAMFDAIQSSVQLIERLIEGGPVKQAMEQHLLGLVQAMDTSHARMNQARTFPSHLSHHPKHGDRIFNHAPDGGSSEALGRWVKASGSQGTLAQWTLQ